MPSPMGRQTRLNAQFQSAFETWPSSGVWQPLHVYDMSAGENRGLEDDPILGTSLFNTRDPTEQAPSLPLAEGQIIVPMCFNQLGFWLRATFGDATTSEDAGVFTHVFKSGQETIPALALEKKFKDNDFRRLRGVKINTLNVRAEKAGGFPRLTLGAMARDEAISGSGVSGTVAAAMALLRPSAARPAARWNTTAMGSTLSVDLTYTNNLERLNYLNGDEYPGELDPGPSTIGGAITMRYQDKTWVELARAGTTGRLELEWALSASSKIIFDMPKVKLADRSLPITGPGAITASFDFSAELTADADALTVTLINAVEDYPLPPPPPPPPPP